jgi:hypothetical protein
MMDIATEAALVEAEEVEATVAIMEEIMATITLAPVPTGGKIKYHVATFLISKCSSMKIHAETKQK